MSMLSDILSNLANGGTGSPSSATAAVPQNPIAPSYVPQDAVTQQYNLANQLRRVAPATSWAGVAAQGLGAIGGNLVQGDANNTLAANQAMRKTDISNAANATDLPSLEKSLITAQSPDIQSLGLQTKIKQITDDPNKEYRVRAAQAVQYGLQPQTPEYRDFVLTGKLPGMSGEGAYGKTGAIFQGQDGKYYSVQFGANGKKLVEPVTADGMALSPSRGVTTVDEGTGTQVIDKATGLPMRTVPKNVSGVAAAKEVGGAQGKAVVNLPIVENAAQRMLDQIEALKTEPGLSRVTGLIDGRTPNISAQARNAQSRLDEVKGGIFLQAYNDLRGAGQISNAEGESAKAAYARLNDQTLGTPDYTKALNEFEQQIIHLRDIARARAAGGNVTGAAAGTPAAPGQAPAGWSIQKVQ